MARIVRMPSVRDLPSGPRREFVEELFVYYKAAGRPTLREISDRVAADDALAGTASRETIRRMLLGITVPSRWSTVEAVFLVLCSIAGLDPDGDRYVDSHYGEVPCRGALNQRWNDALDADAGPPSPIDDPWATSGGGPTNEEPPF